MASYNEAMLAYAFILSTISTDSTVTTNAPGGVWRGFVPSGTTPPYVIMQHQAGSDVVTVNGVRVMSDMLFQVKCCGPGDAVTTGNITAAAARIDALLGGPPNRPSSGSIVINSASVGWCHATYRQQPLVIDEIVNGEIWTNIGGLYRLLIEQIAS